MKRVVSALTREGTIPVDGDVFGLWAVTPFLVEGVKVGESGAWVITHVPSGYALTPGYGERDELLALARRLSRAFPEDGPLNTVDIKELGMEKLMSLRVEIESAGFSASSAAPRGC